MSNKLTIKQEKFCDKYIECGNASEAYRIAYSCANWKDKSVWEKAATLLNNVKVQSRIKELQQQNREKSEITRERILDELSVILDASIADYVKIETRTIRIEGEPQQCQCVVFKDFSELTERQLRAVESVKQGRNGIELKLHGKNWTIERICKMLGFDAPQEIELRKSLHEMTEEELIAIRDGYE